jgi:hypothetical protein
MDRGFHDFKVMPWRWKAKPSPSKDLSPHMARFRSQARQFLAAEAERARSATLRRSRASTEKAGR